MTQIANNSLNKKAMKAGIWYVVNNILIKSLGIITLPLFSRILTTEEYGIINNFQSWLSVLTIVITLNLHTSIQRAKLDFEDNIDDYLASNLVLSTISCVIFYCVTIIFEEKSYQLFGMSKELITFMYIYIIFYTAFEFMQTKHRIYMKYKIFSLITMITSLLSVLLSLILVINMQEKYWGKIVGSILPIFCISLYMYGLILIKSKTYFNVNYWKYAISLSIPLIPHHLATNILAQFDRIMLTNICGFIQVGLYSMAYNVASLLSMVWVSFNGAWVPWFNEKMSKENYLEIKEATVYYIYCFFIVNILLVSFAPEIIKILAPNEYYQSIYVIPPILLGLFFQFNYSLYVNIQFYYKNNNFIPIGTILSAIINIGLNIVFIPKYGYIAAAYTTLIGYICLFIFHYHIANNICKIDIYPTNAIKKAIIANVILSIIYLALYSTIYLRYIFTISIIFIILMKEKKQIIKLFNIIKNK